MRRMPKRVSHRLDSYDGQESWALCRLRIIDIIITWQKIGYPRMFALTTSYCGTWFKLNLSPAGTICLPILPGSIWLRWVPPMSNHSYLLKLLKCTTFLLHCLLLQQLLLLFLLLCYYSLCFAVIVAPVLLIFVFFLFVALLFTKNHQKPRKSAKNNKPGKSCDVWCACQYCFYFSFLSRGAVDVSFNNWTSLPGRGGGGGACWDRCHQRNHLGCSSST